MEKLEYQNFDLWIERTETEYKVRTDTPSGQAKGRMDLSVAKIGAKGIATLKEMEQVGGALFQATFAGEIYAQLWRSIDRAESQNGGVRFRLRLNQVPKLAILPWEYLYDEGRGRFLFFSNTTPLVRYMELPEIVRPLAVQPPLQLLAIFSSPKDFNAPFDKDAAWQQLREATAELERQGRVKVERLEAPTLSALQGRWRKGDVHILHFHGHGKFDEGKTKGVLVFENADGNGELVSADKLAMLLQDKKSLRVVLLNACEGARGAAETIFAGTAQTLVQRTIPAVIAMQFKIFDAAARLLAKEFYAALADNLPVDAALSEGRKALYLENFQLQAGFPVLYMRAADGQLFEIAKRAG